MSRLTPHQGAVVSAYTGVLACNFDVFHEYVERVMGRPVFTHEFAGEGFAEALKQASRQDFLDICQGADS